MADRRIGRPTYRPFCGSFYSRPKCGAPSRCANGDAPIERFSQRDHSAPVPPHWRKDVSVTVNRFTGGTRDPTFRDGRHRRGRVVDVL